MAEIYLPSQKPIRGSRLDTEHELSRHVKLLYPFNEGGGTVVSDLSGNRNHGTLLGGAGWRVTHHGAATNHESSGGAGAGDKIHLARAIPFPSSFTFICCIVIDSLPRAGGMFGNAFASNEYARLLVEANTTGRLYFDDNSSQFLGVGTFQTGYAVYAFTRDESDGIKVYRDGDQVDSGSQAGDFTLAAVGSYGTGSGNSMDAGFWGFVALDACLSQEQIRSLTSHPWQLIRTTRQAYRQSGGAPSEEISGSSAGSSTVQGALSATGALSGTSAGSATVQGALAALGAISGAIAGQAAAQGAIEGAGALAGAAAGQATVQGSAEGAGALQGSAAGTGSAQGALSGAGAIQGSVAGSASVQGALAGTGALAGLAAGAATVSGDLVGPPGAISGTAAGIATVQGLLQATGALAGTAAGVATTSGTIGAAGSLMGSVAGQATVSGAISAVGQGVTSGFSVRGGSSLARSRGTATLERSRAGHTLNRSRGGRTT